MLCGYTLYAFLLLCHSPHNLTSVFSQCFLCERDPETNKVRSGEHVTTTACRLKLPMFHSSVFHHITITSSVHVSCVSTGLMPEGRAQLTGKVRQCHQAVQATLQCQPQAPARIQSSHPQLLHQPIPLMQAQVWGAARRQGVSLPPLPHPPAPLDRRMPSIKSFYSKDTGTG